ncbi:MAG: hypothetical protein JRH20_15160 [Deltaproteobacteria bacterium]|nr:hypothetical protein [Deltaproteobacteria bacterium]
MFQFEVSDDTLVRAPGRVWDYLLALRHMAIWEKLNRNGLTVELVAEANAMLDEVKEASLPAFASNQPGPVERDAAVKECSNLDEFWLTKYAPIARRTSKAAMTWIFGGQTPQVGQVESLQVVEDILTRLDAIETGAAPQDVDVKVLTGLSNSGLNKAERERVGQLLVAARGTRTLADMSDASSEVSDAAFSAILEKLHLWWKAASGIARTAGLKKVELIRLGLASPARNKPAPSA